MDNFERFKELFSNRVVFYGSKAYGVSFAKHWEGVISAMVHLGEPGNWNSEPRTIHDD